MTRTTQASRSAPVDLLVIGGGINGAGIARDAAGRGLSVVLAEAGDLARGTSSASSKLIHGGLRYLEHYEFGLVREALSERETLWAMAPHIVSPLRFVLPLRAGRRPDWMIRAGLFLYDHLGRREKLAATRTVNLRKDAAGRGLQPDLTRAFAYADCWVDDARMVVLNARDAADKGAEILPRHRVTALARSDDAQNWRATLTPADGSASFDVTARAVINAAGPSVVDVVHLSGTHVGQALRLVRGSHIVIPRRFAHGDAYIFQNPDGRVLFALPFADRFTLIGTTDADHDGSPDGVTPSADEIDYLCRAASDWMSPPVTREEIVWSFAGVRPLVDDGSGRPEDATRGYRFDRDGDGDVAPIVHVFGGKLTTFRTLAEAALEQLADCFPSMGKPWTAASVLPGGAIGSLDREAYAAVLARDNPVLPAPLLHRAVNQYGSCARDWLGHATTMADLGTAFGATLTEAEVRYLTTREWAQTADDVVWRRTKLGLELTPDQIAALDDWMAANR